MKKKERTMWLLGGLGALAFLAWKGKKKEDAAKAALNTQTTAQGEYVIIP